MRDPVSKVIGSTMARPEGAGVDFTRLRADRRRRLADAMAAADLDALVLGRPANAVYATGARQLWTAGARPFGPACVVVASTGHVHLLSTWDEGVPAEIPHEDLYGLSWNPANIHAAVAAVPGLGASRRIGTDSTGPGFPRFLASIAPEAEIVDATGALRSARSNKTADEVACIVTAVAIAEAGLDAMVQALRPGITERDLLAVHLECVAALGAPTPPSEGVACATGPTGTAVLRRVPSTRPIAADDLVALDPGAHYAGYEGGVGRTWPAAGGSSAAQRALAARAADALRALRDACRPGATGADLVAAWRATGEPVPAPPIAHGVGLGMERPVIGDGIGAGEVLEAGMVLALTSWVVADGVGGHLERDLVHVTDRGPELLTRAGRGPAGGGNR